MSDDTPVVILLEAGTAAERLGVSASGLRRLSLIYEEVYEELPRKAKSKNRLWPQIAIERLQSARALLEAERYRTIQEALQVIKSGLIDEVEIEAPKSKDASTQEALQVLADEIRRLRSDIQELKVGNAELQASSPKSFKSDGGLLVRLAKRIERLFTL